MVSASGQLLDSLQDPVVDIVSQRSNVTDVACLIVAQPFSGRSHSPLRPN